LAATPAATATAARTAAAAFVLGRLLDAGRVAVVVTGVVLVAVSARRRGVDRVEPDVRVLKRRRAAAHPGEDVAFAFLAHAATAATASAAASATAVVFFVILAAGGRGLGLVLAAAATATATA